VNSNCGGRKLRTHVEHFNAEFLKVISESISFQDSVDLNHPGSDDSHLFHRRIDLSHPALVDRVSSLTDDPNVEFNLDLFYGQLHCSLQALSRRFLYRERDHESGIPFFLSDHLLLCLDESELNYLPLWADGLDDGSGGVFQESIPEAEMGPSEPGPGYHTGYTVVGAQTDAITIAAAATDYYPEEADHGGTIGDDIDVFSTIAPPGDADDDRSATVGRSVAPQRSATPTTTLGAVIVRSDVPPSESFATDDDGMYADARYAQPAAHQPQGQAIERYVDEMDVFNGAAATSQQGEEMHLDLDSDSDEEMDWGSEGSSTLDEFDEVDVHVEAQ
jgi:hypothetical protein